MTKTVTGFFEHREDADRAVSTLEREGFTRAEISVVAQNSRAEANAPKIGPVHEVGADEETGRDATIGGIAGAVAGLILVLIPGIGPLMAVGPIAGVIGGLGIGAAAGGLIGVFRDMGVSDEEAEYYSKGISRGGAVVAITASDEKIERAGSVMKSSGAADFRETSGEWRKAS